MKQILILTAIMIFTVSCGKNPKALEREIASPAPAVAAVKTIDSLVAEFSYPVNNQLQYNGELIADLSDNNAVVSSAGSVKKGQTLNYITIEGIQFLVYGEDGVFATECEPNTLYPDHGPSHPKCEIAHAESFDKIIVCTSAAANMDLVTAQNWPGSQVAMEDPSLGMICWVNGVKMLSSKLFTY